MPLTLLSQNCGLVDSVAYTESYNGNGTTDYTFYAYISTTSGGSKSVDITIYCGTDSFVIHDCQPTYTSQVIQTYGPYTISTCGTAVSLDWFGYTNTTCSGSSCSGTANVAIPVELIDFKLICKDLTAQLFWTTASENNNRAFVVQGKQKDNEWIDLTEMRGSGNSTELKTYSYILRDNDLSFSHYRLLQIDYDGDSTFSELVKNNCLISRKVSISPNPGTGLLQLSEEVANFSVSNSMGQSVSEGERSDLIDLQNQPAGIYYIHVTTAYSSYSLKYVLQ